MKNEKGLTLVEILAAAMITSVVSILVFSILVNSLKTYERTLDQNALRSEADYIMSYLLKEIYATKNSQITEVVKQTDSNKESYLQIKTNQGEQKIGFIHNATTNQLEIKIKEQTLQISNSKIKLNNNSRIEDNSPGFFTVHLIFDLNGKSTEFVNNISSFSDNSENGGENNE